MTRQHNKRKLNNGGMSLVEVIISITILGIVSIPVLHSLTTAMVYNAKARTRQEMTLTAESIMETFKGYDLETLQGMFDTGGSGISGLPAGVTYTAPALSDIENPPATGITFEINGLTDNKGKTYNATITATPSGTQNVLKMKNMDGTKDAIFTGDRNYDKNASEAAWVDFRKDANKDAFVNYFTTLTDDAGNPVNVVNTEGNPISNTDVESDAFRSYIELYDRKLKFTIKDDGSGNYVVTAQMVYRYYIKDFPYYIAVYPESPSDAYLRPGETPSSDVSEEAFRGELNYLTYPADVANYPELIVEMDGEEELEIYNNPYEAGLDRLFIYYYPQYELGAQNDMIVIDNQAGIDKFYCYIIKQRAQDINETRTGVFENGYSAKVEGHSVGTVFNLYHNFDINIGNGSSTTSPSITGFTNNSGKGESYTTSNDFYEDEVLSYKLKLDVVDTTTGNVVTTISSSMNEKIKVN